MEEFEEVYSNFDKVSGNLIQVVTNTKLPKKAEMEDSVNMCKAIEDMLADARMEGAEEMIRNLFENGADLELVKKFVSALKEEEIDFIYEEVCGSK